MKNIGIWLDKRNAVIVHFDGKNEKIIHLDSNIEEGNIRGGAKSSTPWGPKDAVSENNMLQREKEQAKQYFNAIMEQIDDADQLYIIGPAETKTHLNKALEESHSFNKISIAVETADSMTVPQMVSKMRNYFAVKL